MHKKRNAKAQETLSKIYIKRSAALKCTSWFLFYLFIYMTEEEGGRPSRNASVLLVLCQWEKSWGTLKCCWPLYIFNLRSSHQRAIFLWHNSRSLVDAVFHSTRDCALILEVHLDVKMLNRLDMQNRIVTFWRLINFRWWCRFIFWFLVHLLMGWPDSQRPGSWPDKTTARLLSYKPMLQTASVQRNQCPVWKQHLKQYLQESNPVSAYYCLSFCLVGLLWVCCVRRLSNIHLFLLNTPLLYLPLSFLLVTSTLSIIMV